MIRLIILYLTLTILFRNLIAKEMMITKLLEIILMELSTTNFLNLHHLKICLVKLWGVCSRCDKALI